MKGKTVALILVLVCLMAGTAIASSQQLEKTLHYRDIKITLDGQELVPADATGQVIEPFIIDGTTYLPVRGVAAALGLEVGWDNETSTVILTYPEASKPVYITRTGSKYHFDSTCNGGTYWNVPYSTASGMGLGPCDKCVLKK